MNEQELRALVRSTVARHLGTGVPHAPELQTPIHFPVISSPSLYTGLVNVGDACVIEPAVKCDHCGYCKSHGY